MKKDEEFVHQILNKVFVDSNCRQKLDVALSFVMRLQDVVLNFEESKP